MASEQDRDQAQTPRKRGTWKRRVQRVSLRTKLVVPMVVLAVVPGLAIAIFLISSVRESLRQGTMQHVVFETATKAERIRGFLQTVRGDLLFLSQLNAIRELSRQGPLERSERMAVLRQEAEQEFLIFSQGKRVYYQVRYLDRFGREVVRLNAEEGLPRIVPAEELQDKSHRYYVREATALNPGEVYTSQIDLNMEHGKVAVPRQSVLRFATPIPGREGEPGGLLVINLYAQHLFSLVEPFPPGSEAWWVNEEGTYLEYVGPSQLKQKRYTLANRRRMAEDYGPQQVSTILSPKDQAQMLETTDALLSFATISFDPVASGRRLTLITSQPREPIEAPIRHLTIFLSIVVGVVVVVAAILGILVAHYLTRPVAVLRQATGEIAGGDLSRHVEITTGDEIERLAVDFNAMTDRLREAQERLAAMNVHLEEEVERQTDQLRRMQRGLARTDKLTTIGQMAAGVMHEIGNPLAAMKTRIQVATEDGRLPRGCEKLLEELLKEINRLAIFLHSFSRFSRLNELRLHEVSPGEVVRDVVALVSPELQRRNVSLRMTAAPDVPRIRGDADQLRQLLINLLLNAAEASPDGGDLLVSVDRLVSGPNVGGSSVAARIEVVDKGQGISQRILDKIWDPFFTTKAEGTGLGLAICRQIVQDQGGSIQVRSQPGEGTIVTVTFPAIGTNKSELTTENHETRRAST